MTPILDLLAANALLAQGCVGLASWWLTHRRELKARLKAEQAAWRCLVKLRAEHTRVMDFVGVLCEERDHLQARLMAIESFHRVKNLHWRPN